MKEELKDFLEVLMERKLEEGEIKNIDCAITHAPCTVNDLDLATGKGLANLVVILSEELDYANQCLHCSEKNVSQLSTLLRNSGKIGLSFFKLWEEDELDDDDRVNIIKSFEHLELKK